MLLAVDLTKLLQMFFRYPLAMMLCCLAGVCYAQQDTTPHTLTLRATVDAYYSAQSTDGNDEFVPFLSAGPRDNQFGLNIAQVGFSYDYKRVRAAFTYQAGDIPNAAWSGEFPNIQEANVGFNVAEGLWLDAGLFLTHIGYESILPAQKYLSSTAFLSFAEPFYQSGLRLSYSPGDKWAIQGWLLNGLNSFVDNNDAKSAGVSISYFPTDQTTISYNNLLGDEAERDLGITQFLVIQNLYVEQLFGEQTTLVLNLDYATRSNTANENTESASFYGGFISSRFAFDERWSLTGRAEYLSDDYGFITGGVPSTEFTDRQRGLQVSALSLSGEYRPTEKSYFRLAARRATQDDEIALFAEDGGRVDTRWEFLLTFGVAFDRTLQF